MSSMYSFSIVIETSSSMLQNNVSPLFFTNFLLVTCRIKSRIDTSDIKLNFFYSRQKLSQYFYWAVTVE